MTGRDAPVPGQGPEAWRAGHASAPDLLELQATDALLDRIALRLPTGEDLSDPLAAVLVALTAEVDAGRRDGLSPGGPKGTANRRRASGPAAGRPGGPVDRPAGGKGDGGSNGHTFGYADLRPGGHGYRPEGPDGHRSEGPGRDRDDDLGVTGFEIIGDGGELRAQPKPASLAEWKDRLLDLATRKPLSVLAAAAATIGIIFGAVAVGQNLTPLPASPQSPGDPSVSQTQLNGINSALSRADLAVQRGQVGSARQALEDARQAIEGLPQSVTKDTYRKKIEKLRLKVDKTVLPSLDPSGPSGPGSVVTTPAVGPTTSPATPVTTSPPTSVTTGPTTSTAPTDSPSTSPATPTGSTSGTIVPGGEITEDPPTTSTGGGVTPDDRGPGESSPTTAP